MRLKQHLCCRPDVWDTVKRQLCRITFWDATVCAAADSISRAAVPDDSSSAALPSTVLLVSAGLSLVKQAHYPWLPCRQEEGGDGEQEVMIHSVQVKLAPLINPLIWSECPVPSLSSAEAVASSRDWFETGCMLDSKWFVLIGENSVYYKVFVSLKAVFPSVNIHLLVNEEKLTMKTSSILCIF